MSLMTHLCDVRRGQVRLVSARWRCADVPSTKQLILSVSNGRVANRDPSVSGTVEMHTSKNRGSVNDAVSQVENCGVCRLTRRSFLQKCGPGFIPHGISIGNKREVFRGYSMESHGVTCLFPRGNSMRCETATAILHDDRVTIWTFCRWPW